jgi:D-alanine-D-alanine ligase
VWEHASVGLDGSAVVWADRPEELARLLAFRSSRGEGLFFAERYVEGREFNLSLLSGPAGAEVLPPAEMLFLEPAAAGPRCAPPRILCFRSKWEPDSPEYALTRRSFALGPGDGPLLERLRELALRCWGLFGLNGYARVDFRVGPRGPQILEVNANPCIAPDSGFAAAAARGGMGYRDLVERILAHTAPARVPAGRQRRG